MSKTILVTGASGFVGGSVLAQAPQDWTVHACSRRTPVGLPDNVIHHAVDLLDVDATAALVRETAPEAIIHTAAIANIDYSEQHGDEAARINTETTGRLASLAAEGGARLLFCSTDNVFDGTIGDYEETFPVSPVNHYGRTKVASEVLIHDRVRNHLIARVALVIGLPVLGTGNSFLGKMEASLKAGEKIRIPENETRSPIDVLTLGAALLELVDHAYTGVINLAGSSQLNRYEMACRIAAKLGYGKEMVEPINSNEMAGRARRPDDVSLNNSMAREFLKTPMRDLDEALDLIFGS